MEECKHKWKLLTVPILESDEEVQACYCELCRDVMIIEDEPLEE